MERRPCPSTLLLTLVLLMLAPLLLARELGCSYEQHVRSPLMLPARDDDGGAVVPPELDALHSVSRPGGRAPPAPKPNPGYGPLPLHEPSPSHGLGSSPGVSRKQQAAPPPPDGNPSPHDRRSGPAADVLDALLRVFRDGHVRYVIGA